MLGRKSYTQEEFLHAKTALDEQVAAYKSLVEAVGGATADPTVHSALAAFEPLFFNNLTLALDRYFVHRVRMVAGKDGNPLNEVELLCESLMNNQGALCESTVIKLTPEHSVLKLHVGDRIRLTKAEFERLAAAFFAELERKFL